MYAEGGGKGRNPLFKNFHNSLPRTDQGGNGFLLLKGGARK